MIVTVVTAHTSRLNAAQRLCDTLDATMFLDDGTLGEPGNTRAALRWAEQQDATHAIVIQDDAQPVDGFLELAHAAINERPDHIISYYLGTGRPAQAEAGAAIRQAKRGNAEWLTLQRLYWGVAWSTPTDLLPRLNRWLATHDGPTDRSIGHWMRTAKLRCSYVWPCLVDHKDDRSLIHRGAHIERKAWAVRTPASQSD